MPRATAPEVPDPTVQTSIAEVDDIDLIAQRAFRDEGGEELQQARDRQEFEDYLLSVCSHELEHTTDDQDLEAVRIRALEYYEGVPRNVKQGRSKFVSTDLADVVEWIMPVIMKALAGSESCVSFDPVDEGDIDQAQQETDYCHHVLFKDNRGWAIVYSMVKDALLQKNGPAKVYWCKSTEKTQETYEGLTLPEALALIYPEDGTEVTVLEHNIREELKPLDPMLAAVAGTDPGTLVPMEVFDLVVDRKQTRGVCKVESLPPEELRVSRDADGISLLNVRFVAHESRLMVTELVEMGFPYDLVVTIPDYDDLTDSERQARRYPYEHDDIISSNPEGSTRAKRVYECYPLVDIDDDGIAERLRVYIAGNRAVSGARAGGTTGYTFLGWERVDGVNMTAVTPFMLTHRFHGVSLFDRMVQIQDQKTELVRQIFDNVAYQNNGRHLVVANQVNLNDLLVSRPGGVVRAKSTDSVVPLKTPPLGAEAFQVLEYLDKARADRAGVSPDSMFQGLNIGTETAHGIERLMSAREELVGLIVRLMAETGMRDLYLMIRETLMKHEMKSRVVELRGKWVPVNPSEWRRRYNTTVQVGAGPGDILAKKTALAALREEQKQLKAEGSTLVNEQREYHTLANLVRYSDLGDPDLYFISPTSDEGKAAAQAKQEAVEAGQAEAEAQQQVLMEMQQAVVAMQEETKRQKALMDHQSANLDRLAEMQKAAEDLKAKYTEMELKYATDVPGEGMNDEDEAAA